MVPESLRRHPLCFVEDLAVPALSAADRDHLLRSLRLAPGDLVNLSDGAGSWATARLADGAGAVVLDGPIEHEDRVGPLTTVVFAPTKAVKPEWVVQKLTELGIDRIGLIRTERAVVQYSGGRSERVLNRLGRVIEASSKQSRRTRRPVLLGTMTLAEFLGLDGCSYLADPRGRLLGDLPCPAVSPRNLAVGPEGGWSRAEAGRAPLVRLPGRVLRSDTAAVAAGLVLMA